MRRKRGIRGVRLGKLVLVVLFLGVLAIIYYNSSGEKLASESPKGPEVSKTDDQAPALFITGQLIVKFKEGVTFEGRSANVTSVEELNRRFNVLEVEKLFSPKAKDSMGLSRIYLLKLPAEVHPEEAALEYEKNEWVEFAEPNYIGNTTGVPNDPLFFNQWHLTKIKAPEAWDITHGSSDIKIAILDSGIDQDHPDLAPKIVANIIFSGSPTADDLYGHGTHIAGTAAALTNNNIGVAGVGYDSSLMNVKVLANDGAGFSTWVANGIIWATDNGANVISISWGSSGPSSTLETAVNYAWANGVVFVAGAGNNGNPSLFYPPAYGNAIAVAGTTDTDERWSRSSFGDWVSVAAPARGIYSTYPGGSYISGTGTSFAAPQVAGLAGLLFTVVSDVNGNGRLNDEVRAAIELSADDIGVSGIGYGRINAQKAVTFDFSGLGWVTGQVLDNKTQEPIKSFLMAPYSIIYLTSSDGRKVVVDGSGYILYKPAGTYTITASAAGYTSSSKTIAVSAGQESSVDFYLVQYGNIEGYVRNTAGGRIEGAKVEVFDSEGTLVTSRLTNVLGFYQTILLPPATYTVVASATGYKPSSKTVIVPSGTYAVASFNLEPLVSNNSPILEPIGNKIVNEGELLTFIITATDPDGDALTYSASNLPSGATFNQATRLFTWTPSSDQAGTYSNVRFEASDGIENDYEEITITVNDVLVDTTPPTFTMQYYSDLSLTTSLGDNPRLGTGTYYIKITSNEALTTPPLISIDAEGTANDVTSITTTSVSGNDYKYERVINEDASAAGLVLENIAITGTDTVGNTATNVNPTNEAAKAAYTDTASPARSNGQPTGTTNSSMTLSLDTDEAATCKYSTTAGTIYESMTNTFSTTGSTSHSQSLSGLPDGTKNYYVRCMDSVGNKNADDYIITFTVDTTPPTFTMQYYSDLSLTTSLGDNPRLGTGTYYIKITSNEALTTPPLISIDAEGTANDVTSITTTSVSGNDYKYERIIAVDALAIGAVLENISITGTDTSGNTANNANPANEADKAAYTDTTLPEASINPINATSSIKVTLELECIDPSGIKDVSYSNDGIFDTEPFEKFSNKKIWDLTPTDGNKTVFYQCRDNSLNYNTVNISIILDSKEPFLSNLNPDKGAADVPEDTKITMNILDDGIGIDISSIKIIVEGLDAAPDIEGTSANYTVISVPSESFQPEQTVRVVVRAEDLVGNKMVDSYSFTIKAPICGDGICSPSEKSKCSDDCISIKGNLSNVTTNLIDLKFKVNNSEKLYDYFDEKLTIEITENKDESRIERVLFDFPFHEKLWFWLNELKVWKQGANETRGYLLVKGVNLTAERKNLLVDRVGDGSLVCIRDEEVGDINDVSAACNDANEFLITCDGVTTADGYTCKIGGNYFNVTGLRHSAVMEFVGTPDKKTMITQDKKTEDLLLFFGIIAILFFVLIFVKNDKKNKIYGKGKYKVN